MAEKKQGGADKLLYCSFCGKSQHMCPLFFLRFRKVNEAVPIFGIEKVTHLLRT